MSIRAAVLLLVAAASSSSCRRRLRRRGSARPRAWSPMPDGHQLDGARRLRGERVRRQRCRSRASWRSRPTATSSSRSRCGTPARSRSCATRTTTAWRRRARPSRPDSTGRSASRSGTTISTSATTTRWCGSPTTPARRARDGPPEKIVDLPPSDAALDQDTANRLKIDLSQTRGYNHWTRNVIFNPAGTKLYVTVGSATNATPETRRRGARRSTNTTRTARGHRVFASGLRNPVGLAYFPGTNTLWTAVNERDQLGDDLVPDYITSVRDGGFYGWPYSYLGQHVDPTVDAAASGSGRAARSRRTCCCRRTRRRSGCIFYTGSQFPPEYRNSAFVALHGSDQPIEAVGLHASCACRSATARRAGAPEDFLSGFIARDDDEKEAWGRPVGLLQLPDGSLLVSDDGGNSRAGASTGCGAEESNQDVSEESCARSIESGQACSSLVTRLTASTNFAHVCRCRASTRRPSAVTSVDTAGGARRPSRPRRP